jgi:probable phosphoglycerate mutase
MPAASGPDLVLVRHGETAWSRSGRHTGRTDLPLTEVGEGQARSLRPLVSSMSFALVLSSPLARAVRTAELAGAGPPAMDPDLREWDYGDYEGWTTPEIQDTVPGWTVWTGSCPGGESIEEVAARVDRVVDRVRRCPPGSTVAAFGHGHSLRVLAARWLGANPSAGRWLALSTGTVSRLGWEHGFPVVRRWNVGAGPPEGPAPPSGPRRAAWSRHGGRPDLLPPS